MMLIAWVCQVLKFVLNSDGIYWTQCRYGIDMAQSIPSVLDHKCHSFYLPINHVNWLMISI